MKCQIIQQMLCQTTSYKDIQGVHQLLNNCCLADYVSLNNIHYPENLPKLNDAESEENLVADDDKDFHEYDDATFGTDDTILTLNNGVKIFRRKNKKVIRYVRFNKNKN